MQLAPGDRYVIESGGGGGFGDPKLRSADQVAHDVRQAYVSVDSAKNDYGVVLTDDLEVDADATERARAK